MPRAPGKRIGYVILPVGIPADKSPEGALNDTEKCRVVWQILNALRAHDERVDATINQMSLGQDVCDKVQIIGIDSKELDIRVIIGNPPYAVSHHADYPHLDGRIGATFAARSTATNKNALYDSYIRAIRWGADRLGDSGVLA